ncbi:MAG: TonB-dependent receptor domain-containing protein, partial [Steroidobacterales bacterium]
MIRKRQMWGSLLLGFVLTAVGWAASTTMPVAIDIPAQALGPALQELASQAQLQILFEKSVVEGLQSPAVHGTFPPGEALEQMLKGTTLEYVQTAEGAIVVRQRPASTVPESPAGPAATRTDTAAADRGALEEVVVTALRREQNIQDLGISIAELSGAEISDLRMTQPVDIARATPGLVAVNATSDSTPIFAIRGVGLDDFNINNSSGVGVYSDEVFASSPAFLTGPLFDIERIEVLKGPQGTLYGRNATGGAINIISREPTREWSGQANASYSRWGLAQFDGGTGGPLGERLSFRVAGALDTQREGWQRDTDTGQELGKLRRGALRLQLKADLTESIDLLLNLHAARDRSTPESPQSPNVEEAATACCGVVPDPPNYFGTPIGGLLDGSGDPTEVRVGPIAPFTRANTQGASARLTARFDDFTLTSITAFDRNTTHGLDNYDGLPVAEFDFYRHFSAKQFSEELRVASSGERYIDWIAGVAYSRDEVHSQDALDGSFTVLASIDNGLIVLDADYVQKTESMGVFAHGEAHINDQLSLILGLRFSHDKVSFDGTTSDRTGFYLGGAPGDTVAALDDSQSKSSGTFVTGLNYHLNDRVMFYGTLSNGYKGGVYYGLAAVTPEAWGYTKPERVTSIELGMKTRAFNDRLQLNGAVFHADYSDRQSSVTVSSPFIFATLANIPRSRIEGAELELSAKPGAGFEFQSALAWLDTKITRTTTEVRGLP